MKPLHQTVLIVSTLALSWFVMMVVHESGHVLGAWLTGGTVARVVLHPLTISRTDLSVNPRPLFVVWAGPLFGVIVPLLAWIGTELARAPVWYLLRFFAGFCLIANGAYIGIGSIDNVGDAGDLLRHGAPIWQLWLFGIVCVPAGFVLWHGLGPHLGLGEAEGNVNVAAAYGCLMALIIVVILMALLGGE
ncbi:MAG: M50 family metallopeptidase [Planctomycetes bacterium]|nr:M50 family metallopeptidase [Planctomycetota bacterium]